MIYLPKCIQSVDIGQKPSPQLTLIAVVKKLSACMKCTGYLNVKISITCLAIKLTFAELSTKLSQQHCKI